MIEILKEVNPGLILSLTTFVGAVMSFIICRASRKNKTRREELAIKQIVDEIETEMIKQDYYIMLDKYGGSGI